MNRKYLYGLFPLLGTVFGLWYIFTATCDGIYTDYVRLVNSYLPDVWNPAKFFVPDVLTRIPVNYLGRILNVSLFGYNTMFDRVLGVLALGLSGLALGSYCSRRKVSPGWFGALMIVLFSLNKWEMLTNGSGWAHFLSFACFYYHYEVMDRVWSGQEKKYDRIKLLLLPFLTTLLVAGPYCAIYSVTVIIACGIMFLLNKGGSRKVWGLNGLCALIPLLLYLWSNAYAVEDHAAPATVPLLVQLRDTPGFFVRFLIKSFSSMVIEGEQAEHIFRTNTPFLILGSLVILLYLFALWLNLRYRLYEKTVLPVILIVSGGLNHVLILLSRWIFLQENYGLSSRYALQFQSGILGILLTFALLSKQWKNKRNTFLRIAACGACVMFLAGNCYTTYAEIKKAPNRRDSFDRMAVLALNFETATDDELRAGFEYRPSRPDSGAKVRSALTILKENGYSIFRNDFKR
ncbi:hypothetical protein [Lacrimispora celerecrescens]|uniref:Glucosyltransferase GtrII-like protein n=1 Tax=[Clostridium] celerecrescens 18A TaxID=1286362 RepID=A0A2M8ZBX0_9FIRM|nr:hypothetical protein [Lacrimispora celerecrescens]PJJ30930.1 hypothetical protein H171_4551 [[Clostridium] celerecrescens 18A]